MTAPLLPFPPAAVFFDLDGTLADTAEDLAAPVNAMRVERGLDALPIEALRPVASMGARGLIGKGLGVDRDDPAFPALRDEFLRRYEAGLSVRTRLFPGMPDLLDALDAAGVPWGVVSNKVQRYVEPIVDALGLGDRCRTRIGGDTTAFAKPHPEPLLHAARLVGVSPTHCVYVGDDRRDIEAARAAGMKAVVAAYGYCGEADPPQTWGGDALVQAPDELSALLGVSPRPA